MMLVLRPMAESDSSAILALVETLPEWFTPDALTRAIPFDLRHQPGFVAVGDGEIVGFVTLFFAEGLVHIGWLGVRRDRHRQGIGTRLLERAEQFGSEQGASEIATYTLGDGVEYAPYEATRQFYFDRGFTVYQRNTTDNPGCPEEIRIKKTIGSRA